MTQWTMSWQKENPTHPPIVIVTIVAKELEEPPHL